MLLVDLVDLVGVLDQRPKPSPLLTSWNLPVCIAMVDSGGAEVPSEVRLGPVSPGPLACR